MVSPPSQRSFGSSGNSGSETSPTSVSFPILSSKYNIASSAFSTSEYSPKSVAPRPVKAIAKPTPKSHLGSVTVNFHPPRFQTFRVKVTAEGKPIESQRLRHKAIESFLEKKFPGFGTNYAINTQAEREDGIDSGTNIKFPLSIVDHIIFPFSNTAQEKWIKSRIDGKSDTVKDVTKQPKRKDGGEGKPIRCEVLSGAVSDQEFDRLERKNLKARNLDIHLRHLAKSDTADKCQTLHELPDVFDDEYKKVDVAMVKHESAANSRPSIQYTVKLRRRMLLDYTQSNIRFDYDLIPVIPNVLVSEVIQGVFGSEISAKDGAFIIPGPKTVDYLPMVKNMLCGLKIHCAYLPNNRDKAHRLSPDVYWQVRCFQIKDVRMPDEETHFKTDDGTSYTVQKYFDEVISPADKLEHPEWPLVQDDRKAWLPLEKLYVASNQVLSRCGYLNERLLNKARMYMKNHGANRLCQEARGVYKQIAGTRVGKQKSSNERSVEGNSGTKWLNDDKFLIKFTENPDLFPNRKTAKPPKEKLNIALLRIDYNGDEDATDSFFEPLQTDLGKIYFSRKYDCTKDDIFVSGKSIKDIVGETRQHDLIMAVTCKSLENVQATKQILARLHSLCEREYGIMLVCQTGKSLADFYIERKVFENCFPVGLQRRIDFMLGKPHFVSSTLATISRDFSDRFTIMGAHIMHKSLYEKSRAMYMPSIAAVVASTNGTALNFPGSARFQHTTARIADSSRVPQYSIPNLLQMLRERFQVWANQMAPPTYILFYRDSLEFDHAVVWDEVASIRDAFKDHFGERTQIPLITYIVVNKNTEVKYLPYGPDAPSAHLSQDFVLNQGKAKYRYYVVCNDMNLTNEHL